MDGAPGDASRRGVLRAAGALGVSALVLPAAGAAGSPSGTVPAPEGSTLITWTNGELFDAWEQPTSTTTDRSERNAMGWQLFLAHRALTIPAGTPDAYGIATIAVGDGEWTWYASVSAAAGTVGPFGAPFAVAGPTYAEHIAGQLVTSAATVTLTVPAGHYFLVGTHAGPYFRSVRYTETARTAMLAGVPQVTAIDRAFYAFLGDGSEGDAGPVAVPTDLTGEDVLFWDLEGMAFVMSIRPTMS